jgi:hypothetical protein
MHLAVAPAIDPWKCMLSKAADHRLCHENLQKDWDQYSGRRMYYGVLVGLAPLPLIWMMAFGFSRLRRLQGISSLQGRSNDWP